MQLKRNVQCFLFVLILVFSNIASAMSGQHCPRTNMALSFVDEVFPFYLSILQNLARHEKKLGRQVSVEANNAIKTVLENPQKIVLQFAEIVWKDGAKSHNGVDLNLVEPDFSLRGELLIRILIAEAILGEPLSQQKMTSLWRAHLEGKAPYDAALLRRKAEILRSGGFRDKEATLLSRAGITGYKYIRKFRVSESPAEAQEIIDMIEISDAMKIIPPGVSPKKVGPGIFQAKSPILKFRSKLEVSSDGYVREYNKITVLGRTKVAGFMMAGPLGYIAAQSGTELFAETMHNVFTSPEAAYNSARKRWLGLRRRR